MTDPTRPAAFDAALTDYLPSLRAQAAYISRDNADDILSEAVTNMLHLADRCRMETFRTWAQIVLRRTAGNFSRSMRQQKRTGIMVSMPEVGMPAGQESSTELRQVLSAIGSVKNGDILLRRAKGDLLREIGRDRGTHKENIRQLETKARTALRAQLGMGVAA